MHLETTVSFDVSTTVIVGRNNSGKRRSPSSSASSSAMIGGAPEPTSRWTTSRLLGTRRCWKPRGAP
ncbi:MAG: hypothetical protein IPG96_16400 [Proteobacteria bacterium]|nr:hypothetical protein [Pseudomonadota bacterium]